MIMMTMKMMKQHEKDDNEDGGKRMVQTYYHLCMLSMIENAYCALLSLFYH